MRTLWLLLGLAACGGKDYCERSASAAEDCGEPLPDAELATCEAALSECTADDAALLDEMYDCFEDNGLLACAETGETADVMAFFACAEPLDGLSATCSDGLFGAEVTAP